MTVRTLSVGDVQRALAVRDLTDERSGPHALQQLVCAAIEALSKAWSCAVTVDRQHPVVPVADNYDRLHYPPDGAARDARYTRYVSATEVLRTQTSAMIPPLLRRIAPEAPRDRLLVCPGLVYRRDSIDRLHTGEPHQLDLWRVCRTRALGRRDLHEMIACVVGAVLPGRAYRTERAEHPYTVDGLQIDVRDGERWVEIGECGLALPALLEENGHPPPATGLAMGLGLDRIVMLRKGLDDIRLLRSTDPRIAAQLRDLEPYRPVSAMPPVKRDLSLVVAGDADPETLGDEVRAVLGPRADVIETVEVVAETPYAQLPGTAVRRLGLAPDQKNVLLRVVLRALDRTLTHAECNALRDEIYAALHRGPVWEWAVPDAAPRVKV